MRPHDDSGLPAVRAAEVDCQRVERVDHVLVPQVPGRHPAPEHRAVVLLRRLDRPGILLGVEQLVLGEQPVTPGVLHGVTLEVDELVDRLPFAGVAGPECCLVAVRLRVLAEVVEAGVALPCAGRSGGIHRFEVGDDLLDGPEEAVKVEAVEARLCLLAAGRAVVALPQPPDEVQHDVGVRLNH